MERIIQTALHRQISNSNREVMLTSMGGKQVWNTNNGLIDIVAKNHGIELKVVRLPRLGATPSNSLYDVGQLSSDYWRLANASGLASGELVVLLYGPLVRDLPSENSIYREFHNRMYVDYMTSLTYSELSPKWLSAHPELKPQRERQVKSIKKMGFHNPFYKGKHHLTVRVGKFALVSIQVARGA